MIAPEDAVIEGGTGVDLPYRFLSAFASGLAAKLARKYPPSPQSGVGVNDLKQEAQEELQAALLEDIERVNLYVQPGIGGYFR